MIILFIIVIILVLGIVLARHNKCIDILEFVGVLLIVCGSIALIISLMVIIISHATVNKNIQQNKIKYDGLCKRYEIIKSEYEDVSKSDVIADITAWNVSVYNIKYWTENPWTNWFNPKSIADNLEYIPLE